MRLRGGVDREIESVLLEGNRAAFVALSGMLRRTPPAEVMLDSIAGVADGDALRRFTVRDGTDEARVTIIEGGVALLTGAAEARARVAEEIDLFLEHNDLNEPGMHAHIDASDDGGLLAPGSLNLLLIGPVAEQAWS